MILAALLYSHKVDGEKLEIQSSPTPWPTPTQCLTALGIFLLLCSEASNSNIHEVGLENIKHPYLIQPKSVGAVTATPALLRLALLVQIAKIKNLP